MKILQLIDSLDAGGAERMAVSLANELLPYTDSSHICVTRKEGLLKESINPDIGYLFLDKKTRFDFKAFAKLLKYVKKNNITHIHAHSTSFFFAVCVRLMYAKVRVVWHDHYGNSEQIDKRDFGMLRRCSKYFSAIISVNTILQEWAKNSLKCDQVFYLKNFVSSFQKENRKETVLKGNSSIAIICLANLRPQKDHFNLLAAYTICKKQFPEISLHLVGGYVDEMYTNQIKNTIASHNMDSVYLYGAQKNAQNYLLEAHIGVLSSTSEGLPVALLEYGEASLPVIVTDVGQCKEVVHSYGQVVPSNNSEKLAVALSDYIKNEEKRTKDALLFKDHIRSLYSFKSISEELLNIYKIN